MPERQTTGTFVRLRFGVPPVAAAFAGRGVELETLEQVLSADGRALITQAISGLGGVGKTQLASRYVHTHADEYDIVAWIHAEDGGIADFAALAAKLGEPVGGLSPVERRDLALERLARGDERWLLVLDNVDSPAQLPDCVPQGGNGRVLITSRNQAVREFAPLLALDVFDPQAAVDYLTDRTERPDDAGGAELLAKALGYLPLALSHAAAYCAAGMSFDNYAELLDGLPAETLFDSHPEVAYTQTVASTWKTSIAAASTDSPLADSVLALAAFLGPDAIPKSLFTVLAASETLVARKCLADAFTALARFSLATVDDNTLSVHRLLQKVVRDDASTRQSCTASTRALVALDQAFPTDTSNPTGWQVSEQLIGHVLALADTIPREADNARQLVELLDRAHVYLAWTEGGTRALELAQRSTRQAERMLGVDNHATLRARRHEAAALRQAGRTTEAVGRSKVLLADHVRIFGSEHADTLAAREGLAHAYRDVGRLQDAVTVYEQALLDSERLRGAEDHQTLSVRNEIGIAYLRARRFHDAIAIFEPLLALRRQLLGATHPSTLTTRHNLAETYSKAGRADEAIAILEPLLIELEQVHGATHPHTLTTQNGLGLAYVRVGRAEEAIAVHKALLNTFEQVLGTEHPHTLGTRLNLALACRESGRVEQAIVSFEALLADCRRILGPEHVHTLTTRARLGVTYQAAGRPESALATLEPLAADFERLCGIDHPETLAARKHLATAYRAAGREEEASG
jgi:tetratricopeptide (TPR) repeat protein